MFGPVKLIKKLKNKSIENNLYDFALTKVKLLMHEKPSDCRRKGNFHTHRHCQQFSSQATEDLGSRRLETCKLLLSLQADAQIPMPIRTIRGVSKHLKSRRFTLYSADLADDTEAWIGHLQEQVN